MELWPKDKIKTQILKHIIYYYNYYYYIIIIKWAVILCQTGADHRCSVVVWPCQVVIIWAAEKLLSGFKEVENTELNRTDLFNECNDIICWWEVWLLRKVTGSKYFNIL